MTQNEKLLGIQAQQNKLLELGKVPQNQKLEMKFSPDSTLNNWSSVTEIRQEKIKVNTYLQLLLMPCVDSQIDPMTKPMLRLYAL
jgi:hypothetical protein